MTAAVPSLSEAAQRYALAGWPVLPTRGTVPLVPRATVDPTLIRRWWRQWPSANVAAAIPDGVVVLDLDAADGSRTIKRLRREHGTLPATLEFITDDARRHMFFTASSGQVRQGGCLGPGVEVLATGSSVLLPPSVSTAGLGYRRYEWVDPAVSMAPLPRWVAEQLRPPARTPAAAVLTAGASRPMEVHT